MLTHRKHLQQEHQTKHSQTHSTTTGFYTISRTSTQRLNRLLHHLPDPRPHIYPRPSRAFKQSFSNPDPNCTQSLHGLLQNLPEPRPYYPTSSRTFTHLFPNTDPLWPSLYLVPYVFTDLCDLPNLQPYYPTSSRTLTTSPAPAHTPPLPKTHRLPTYDSADQQCTPDYRTEDEIRWSTNWKEHHQKFPNIRPIQNWRGYQTCQWCHLHRSAYMRRARRMSNTTYSQPLFYRTESPTIGEQTLRT